MKRLRRIIEGTDLNKSDITLDELYNYLKDVFSKRKISERIEEIKDPPIIDVNIWENEGKQRNVSFRIISNVILFTGIGGFIYYWNLLPELSKLIHQFNLNGKHIEKDKLFEILNLKQDEQNNIHTSI